VVEDTRILSAAEM